MLTVIVSPLSHSASAPFFAVALDIHVKPADFTGLFDKLELWRSRSTEGGPYEEITSRAWMPARVPKSATDQPSVIPAGPSVNIVGKTLGFLLGEQDELSITFTGSDPLTFAQVATQITSQSGGALRSYVVESDLVVETTALGTSAALRVLESDAAVLLALPTQEPDSLAFGREARIQLRAGVSVYQAIDRSSSSSFFYKTRFRNSSTGVVSEFSQAFGVFRAVGVPSSSTVIGYLDLVMSDGRPLVGREVSVRCVFDGTVIADKLVAGEDLVQRSDAAGHVEFTLLRGQRYTLAIAGTNLVKDVTAPTDTARASFSLVDPTFGNQEDYFRVRVPEIPTMERRSF